MKPLTLLRLYPRWWRERYGDEFLALLEREGTGRRVVVNVFAGAFDAWVSPKNQAEMTKAPIGPRVVWLTGVQRGKYEAEWWRFLGLALVAGLVVHGIGQLVHPGRGYPISFLAGFMAAWQLWLLRQFAVRTRVAAALWVLLFMIGGTWVLHYSMHRYVYPLFGYEA
jgi:hypothetical protein